MLTGPEALSLTEAVNFISKAAGRAIGYAALEEAEFRSMMVGFGLPPNCADMVVRDQITIRNGFGGELSDTVELVTDSKPILLPQFAQRAFAPALPS